MISLSSTNTQVIKTDTEQALCEEGILYYVQFRRKSIFEHKTAC